jgi:N-acylneuraminate cytidylyltransferase
VVSDEKKQLNMKIAIIPARGGSKRIPGKNIKDFHGQPMIAYAIKNALDSQLFDEVFVSTDDERIAEISKHYGAKVPVLRSSANSDDYATTSEVLLEVLEYFEKEQELPELACCIYATTPLLTAKDIMEAYQIYEQSSCEVLMSCVAYDFPIQRAFELDSNNYIHLKEPHLINQRSQDLPKYYHDAGAFYFFNPLSFKENKSLWKGKLGAYPINPLKVQDIDSVEDWKMAEIKFQLLINDKATD